VESPIKGSKGNTEFLAMLKVRERNPPASG
jgi:predicted rRNA methylase YqxC with S4 and FtsJ domains